MIIPESFHSASDHLPRADNWAGDPAIKLKLRMADIEGARYAVRMLFEPGTQVFTHKHTGEVHAFTIAGEWNYLEYPPLLREQGKALPRPLPTGGAMAYKALS